MNAVVSPPPVVQKTMSAVLGPLARRRGWRGAYPELESPILAGRRGEVLTLTGSQPIPEPTEATAAGT
jgi:hypothetical protein